MIASLLGIRKVPQSTNRARAGWAIVAVALALGIAGDLLRAWPLGLNAAAWLAALCAIALVLPRVDALTLRPGRGAIWLIAALAFSLMLLWRSSPVLQTLNLLGVFACLAMVAFPTSAKSVRLAGITEYAISATVWAMHLLAGAGVLAIRYLDWRAIPGPGRSARVAALGRGIAFAAVPVLVFGALFASADVFFRDFVQDLFFFDLADAFLHLLFVVLFAWLAASCLWGALLADRDPAPEVPTVPVRFEFIEVGVVFGLVDALFLAFVSVQFRYLFGGADRVENSSTLTYAEYARRGFFELVAVAALVIPFLLITHWLLKRDNVRLRRFHAAFAAVLVALVFVVMASAVERMRLYQETFGLTELRVYTTAFMAWLFAAIAWLSVTVLRGRRDRFAFGVVIASLLVLVGLNALNPDAIIVRRNAAIVDDNGRPFDSAYALDLSADSVPALVDKFDKVPADEQCAVARELRRRYDDADLDWRSWTWAQFRARRAVSNSDQLATACT